MVEAWLLVIETGTGSGEKSSSIPPSKILSFSRISNAACLPEHEPAVVTLSVTWVPSTTGFDGEIHEADATEQGIGVGVGVFVGVLVGVAVGTLVGVGVFVGVGGTGVGVAVGGTGVGVAVGVGVGTATKAAV